MKAGGVTRKILGVIGDEMTGVGYVRFFQPFRHLREYGYELATLGENLTLVRRNDRYEPESAILDGISAVMFPQMVASPVMPDGLRVDLVEPLCLEARRRGIPVIYSVDDYLQEIEPANPDYERIRDSIGNLGTILRHADAILVTTDVLERSLAFTGKSIWILPNAVDPDDWEPRPGASDTLRIGWTGSSSHVADLRLVVPAIRKAQEKTAFEFVLQGLVDVPIREQAKQARALMDRLEPSRKVTAVEFLDLADCLEEVRYSHVPFGETARFFDVLPSLDLDIGLCPLLDSPFNRHKSANKFYEYAVTGSVTLASDVTPYREEVSVTVPGDSRRWAEIIEEFAGDRRLREEHLERQREFVLSRRNIHHLKAAWREALRQILAAGPAVRDPGSVTLDTGQIDVRPTGT